ncbi:MAG: C25 family cysteine peptidase [Candidatus Glassbacteria bacterium]
MNGKLSGALVCVFVASIVSQGDVWGSGTNRWVALRESEEGSHPVITTLKSDRNQTVVDVDLPGFWTSDRVVAGEYFQELTIPGQTTLMEVGKPALPMIRFLIAIPHGAQVDLSFQAEEQVILTDYRVYPFQQPQKDTGNDPSEFNIDESFYRSSERFPAQIAVIGEPSTWRHLEVVLVEVAPVSYVPDRNSLIVTAHLIVELAYAPKKEGEILDTSFGPAREHWERAYSQHVINYDWLEEREGTRDSEGPVYLLITHPNFESAVQPLAEWHHLEGLETEVVSINTSSYQTIKNEITDRYEQGNLEYVLLVGDTNYMPVYYWDDSLSDYWYACITGPPDNYADIAVGRLSVTSSSDAENQVSKILAYEKNPPLDDWLTDITLVAHREDAPGKYVECKENIRTNIIQQPPFSVETIYGHLPDGVNAHVTSAINDGCNVVNYRGHGTTTTWVDWDYYWNSWTTSHVMALANNDYTPIVFNIACDNHQIQTSCLGEYWLNKYPGGAVASLGATDPSWTVPNHDYDKWLFREFNIYNEYRIGWMSNHAATYIINSHGSYGVDNARMYLWLGDPATEIWTNVPDLLSVDHPSQIITGYQVIDITVTSGGDPLEGATVCLYKQDEVYEVGTTGADGVASFSVTPATGGTLYVTVTEHDFLPYEGEIQVTEFIPNMALTLTPDAESFPRGSDLGYTVQGTNNEDTPQTLDYWTEVYLPNGNPYQGNPVLGPVTVTIPAGASPSVHLSHYIGPNIPLWTFTYRGCIGIYDINQVWYEDSFEFTVIE